MPPAAQSPALQRAAGYKPWAAPYSRTSPSNASTFGVGTPTARVPVDLAAPLPGAWGLTVRMARGVGADVETALTVAYTA